MTQDSYATLQTISLASLIFIGTTGIVLAKSAIKNNRSERLGLAGFLIGLGFPLIGMIFIIEWIKKSIPQEADRKAIHSGAVKGFGLAVILAILFSMIPIETSTGGTLNSSDYPF